MLTRKLEPPRLVSRSQRIAHYKKEIAGEGSFDSEAKIPASKKIIQLIEHYELNQLNKSGKLAKNRLSEVVIDRKSNLCNLSLRNNQILTESLERRYFGKTSNNQEASNRTQSMFIHKIPARLDNSLPKDKTCKEFGKIKKDEFRLQLNDLRNSFVQITQPKRKPSFFDQYAKKTFHPYMDKTRKNSGPQRDSLEKITIRKSGLKIKKQFQDYLNYIHSPFGVQYGHSSNYDNFRELKRKQSVDRFDMKTAYSVENIFLMVYQTLNGQSQIPGQAQDSIRELCHFYFFIKEKGELQTLIVSNYLRGFTTKLRQLFVAQRTALYYMFILNEQHRLFVSQFRQVMKKAIYELHVAYALVIRTVLEAIDQGSEIGSKINTTFKALKNMCEAEKNIELASDDLKTVVKIANNRAIYEIQKHLQMLLDKGSRRRFEEKVLRAQMHLSWKYLKIPPTPYLPQSDSQTLYTLVLDLDETLVHYDQSNEILKFRPGLLNFMNTLSSLYEVILFTASTRQYADKILRELDPKKSIFQFRLYREHMRYESKRLLKDITRLGRDIRRVVIVDNTPDNFRNCLANGVTIDSWIGDKDDLALSNLLPILVTAAEQKVEDVRDFFKCQKLTLTHISQQNEESISSIVRA